LEYEPRKDCVAAHSPSQKKCPAAEEACSSGQGSSMFAAENVAEQRLLQDGGGIFSTGDWGLPHGKQDVFKPLRDKWTQRAKQWGLGPRLQDHLAKCEKFRETGKGKQWRKPGSFLSPGEIKELKADMVAFLTDQGHPCTGEIADGQPFTLQIWRAMLELMGDIDTALPEILEQGVPTGIDEAIPASGVWRPRDADDRPDLELLVHTAPWKSGRDDVQGLRRLLQHDAELGFCEKLRGGLK
jgi:hypothetical protein